MAIAFMKAAVVANQCPRSDDELQNVVSLLQSQRQANVLEVGGEEKAFAMDSSTSGTADTVPVKVSQDEHQHEGTNRLGNFLNDWFLVGTCPTLSRVVTLSSRFKVGAGSLGNFLLAHPPAFAESVIPYCDGKWWWSYLYRNWAALASQFQTDLRPKAMQFLKESTNLQIDFNDTKSLVVHYRLGHPKGVIAPSALLRGVEQLYQQMRIPEPLHVTVLAGSFNHDIHGDIQEAKKCEARRDLLIDLLKKRFPNAKISDIYGNADEDWLHMAFAPVLVTSQGSFAVTAAAVNTGYRATVGSPRLNCMICNNRDAVPSSIMSRWITYKLLPCDAIM